MNELMEEGRLRVSTQVLQELFVTLTRKVSQPCPNDEALAVLEDLTAWPVMAIDYAVIRAAARLAGQAKLSFWDALVVVAAARAGADIPTRLPEHRLRATCPRMGCVHVDCRTRRVNKD